MVNKILGYKDLIFKSDQEPALKKMLDKMAMLAGDKVVREESPVGESQSNGDVEMRYRKYRGCTKP